MSPGSQIAQLPPPTRPPHWAADGSATAVLPSHKSLEDGRGDAGVVRHRIRKLITTVSSRQGLLTLFALLVGLGMLMLWLSQRSRIAVPILFDEAEEDDDLREVAQNATRVVTLHGDIASDKPSPDPLPPQDPSDPIIETSNESTAPEQISESDAADTAHPEEEASEQSTLNPDKPSPDPLPPQDPSSPIIETADENATSEQISEPDTADIAHPEEEASEQSTLNPEIPKPDVVPPPKFQFFINLTETKFSAVEGARYMAFGSPVSDTLDAALTSANTVHTLDLESPPIFLYLTGHLRTFVQTASELQRFVDSLERPYVIVQHTWSTTDHGDAAWWRGPDAERAKQSSEEVLAHLEHPFMQHAVIMIEDSDAAKGSGRMPTLPAFFPDQNNPMVLASYYYGLQATHHLALDVVSKISGGAAMPQNTLIVHSRPDIVIQPIQLTRIAELVGNNMDSFFGCCHHDTDAWRVESMSDILYLTTRQVFDRLATVDIVGWCTANSDSYAIQSYPEVDFRLLLQFLNVHLYWLESAFSIVRDSGAVTDMPACGGEVPVREWQDAYEAFRVIRV
ncbi:hypothetical protein CAOG_03982 [Capsaspora owczarzaki ATCC 30864]|uniref:hypothetical protein n=1 Tax=Capsaspora owczarzaki (strain ATCC 30864) TaxID=595528 RepID=UPI0003522D41|nr:hypothetical protein CAOG_03982 [Capsaspora owczarzaki ATCC 30864]|eukprot:XP_004347807.2 hypothetical protein CAOG_03982 [Capsaspora owczarzaki ATCC 30864]